MYISNLPPRTMGFSGIRAVNKKPESPDEKFNRLFILLGGLMVWTYMMAPDVQTTMIALKTKVNRGQIAALWAVSIVGIGLFINAMYKERILPR